MSDAAEAADPRPHWDGDGLLQLLGGHGAASGAALALAGSPCRTAWSFSDMAARVASIAMRVRDLRLEPGATALVTGGASPHALAAVLGVQQAGLRAALLPLGGGPEELAAACGTCGANLLIGAGGQAFGDLETLLAVAASRAVAVRFVAVCGGEAKNGFVDLCAAGEAEPLAALVAPDAAVLTFARGTGAMAATSAAPRRAAAVAAALRRWLPEAAAPVVSTLPPLSMAGLGAGPWLAWSVGVALHLHGPFDAFALAEALAAAGRAHLVLPAALAPAVTGTSALSRHIASLVLVHRHCSAAAMLTARPPALPGAPKIPAIDLHCVGEALTLPVARDSMGRPGAVSEHCLEIDTDARFVAGAMTADTDAAPVEPEPSRPNKIQHRGSL